MRMVLRLLGALLWKDARALTRDARLLLVLVPALFLGPACSRAVHEGSAPDVVRLAYAPPSAAPLVGSLQTLGAGELALELREAEDAAEVRALVGRRAVDVGLVFGPDLTQASSAAEPQRITLIRRDDPDLRNWPLQYLQALLPTAVRLASGVPAEVVLDQERLERVGRDALGLGDLLVGVSLVIVLSGVSLQALPVLLTEEVDEQTLEPLEDATAYGPIVASKALVALLTIALCGAILLAAAGRAPVQPALTLASWLLLGATASGAGLLLGSLARRTARLVLLALVTALLFVGPAVAVLALPILPDAAVRVLRFWPPAVGMRLVAYGVWGLPPLGTVPEDLATLAGWLPIGYALALLRLRRFEG